LKKPSPESASPKYGGDLPHKRLLQNKQTLALVLKSCCPEFRDLTVAEIVKRIEPSNPSDQVRGENVEISDGTSKIVLDTLTSVDLGSCPMLINVEVQAERNPGYNLENRGTYYIARIISIGKDRGYLKKYQHLPKVYSIWLMVDPPKKLAGDIDMQYAITKRFKKNGTIELLSDDPVKSKYCLVKVYLPEGDPDLTNGDPINILGVLFRNRNCQDKKKFMEDNGLPVNKDLSEVLMHVRTIEDVMRDDYTRIGKAEGKTEEKQATVIRLLKMGVSISLIQAATDLSVAAINNIAKSLKAPASLTPA